MDNNTFDNASASKARKIVFCVDASKEMLTEIRASMNTGIKNTSLYYSTRLSIIQRFLKRFVKTNTILGNSKDEYAVIILTEIAIWELDFTPNVDVFCNTIDGLGSLVNRECKDLDTQSIFDIISEHVQIEDDAYFTQTILIYSRDSVVPQAPRDYERIRHSPNFVMDVIFMHDRKLSDSVQSVYDFWSGFDSSVVPGWYYETGLFQSKDNLTKAFSQLLSHPLARKDQEEFDKTIGI